MVWIIGPTEPVNPGDMFEIRFYAQDNVGISRLGLRVNGAFELADSIDLEAPLAQFTAVVNLRAPEGVRLDIPATVTLIVTDKGGHSAEKGTEVQFVDTGIPDVRLNLFGLRPDGTIHSGETLQIHVSATDNQQLGYLGFSVAGLRDSVPTSNLSDAHAFRLTVPSAWVRERQAVTAWARDAAGHGNGTFERQIPVYDFVEHPIQTVPVSADLSLEQVLWDPKRNAVYRLLAGVGTGRIDGINVLSATPLAPIPLPLAPNYFGYSVSTDSLVVAFWYERTLGVVDLLKPVRSTSLVPLQYDLELGRTPVAVQASGEHLFVALGSDRDYGRLMDVNLGTGAQVVRADLAGGTRLAPDAILLPLPDGRMLVSTEGRYGIDERFLYSPVTDAFTRTSTLGSTNPRHFVTSPSGRFLIGTTVHNAALDSVAYVRTWDWSDPWAYALSPDGEALYQTTAYGYQKVRVSDGLLLEQVKLPSKARYLIAIPDGSRLIAVGHSAVMIVSLR